MKFFCYSNTWDVVLWPESCSESAHMWLVSVTVFQCSGIRARNMIIVLFWRAGKWHMWSALLFQPFPIHPKWNKWTPKLQKDHSTSAGLDYNTFLLHSSAAPVVGFLCLGGRSPDCGVFMSFRGIKQPREQYFILSGGWAVSSWCFWCYWAFCTLVVFYVQKHRSYLLSGHCATD